MTDTKTFFNLENYPTVTFEGINAGTWNGWAVPILDQENYMLLLAYVNDGKGDPYEGTKVDGGWLCDGLCFLIKADEDDDPCCEICGALINGESGVAVDAPSLSAGEIICCLECAQALSEGKVAR